MSYTHIHLPSLDVLKTRLEGNVEEIKYYSKYESWIGPNDSVDYLIKSIKSLNN